ncbi:IucA/IucC family protein [Pseudalkalibacillus sp. SCS-8]|uniref:IucA/IucC family protein n=1 Tax=Pseudalkalibacillus nanhaiensis TaxID=3115291 RepID=UPI0032DACCA9
MTIQLIQRPAQLKSNQTSMITEEIACMRFVMKKMPSYVNHFIGSLEKGRKGILHKLASSILRENINNIYSDAIDLKKIGSVFVMNLNVADESWRPFFNHIQTYPIREDITYKVVPIDNSVMVFPIANTYAYQRIETTDEILYVDEEGITPITLASDLLKKLFSATANRWNMDTFIKELDNGTANLTLAYMYEQAWKETIQDEAKRLGSMDTLDYLLKKKDENESFSASLFFEQLVLEGHHLHPGSKTKIGLTHEDVFRYSPEFHQVFQVGFVAVKKDCLLTTTGNKGVLEEHYPEELELCLEELDGRGYDSAEYDILPVHQWQYEHVIPKLYADEVKNADVVFIKDVKVGVEATSSFRTVYPQKGQAPALKLAVNSQMTSTVRSISTQTALNSTLFTEMMQSVMEKEAQLENFQPLNEIVGAAFKSEEEGKSRNLTMLMRENIDEKLQNGELAIAGPALYAQSPVSGETVLAELVNQYAEANNLSKSRAAFPFFDDYIAAVIPGYLTLMVKYGIALEGHLQNSIPVFKDGKLSRFFFRDWGGARIYKERLTQQGIAIQFTPGSMSVTDDLGEMHNKLYYTVFQNHLGEIIRQLVLYSGIKEEDFWSRVKMVCEETLQSLSLQKDLVGNIEEDRAFLFQPVVKHKSLTTMRLTGGKGYCYSEVPNPLTDAGELHD